MTAMPEVEITEVISEALMHLGNYSKEQRDEIQNVLQIVLSGYTIGSKETALMKMDGQVEMIKILQLFLVAKRVEGCAEKTLKYYRAELQRFQRETNKAWRDVTADDIRLHIARMAVEKKVSKVTQDNTLRILRSFFGWTAAEGYVDKNPALRVKKIKQEKKIKKPFSEIEIERLRNGARDLKERAMIDLLLSTGMRIGEMERLNRGDIEGDQMVVYGKGGKERYVYLNAKAIVSIEAYLKSRTDDNEALFVSDMKPNRRLRISGFEIRLRELGRELAISNVHPHRFRRTAATLALNRGMPIDQVQQMLGHEQIATTLIYAQSAQENVKASHKKYVV